jgi:hypothetical protein
MNILFAYKFNRMCARAASLRCLRPARPRALPRRRYAVGNGVTCNAVNPGIVPGTDLLRDQPENVRPRGGAGRCAQPLTRRTALCGAVPAGL